MIRRPHPNLLLGLTLLIVARLLAFRFFPLCAEDFFITAHAALDPAWRVAVTSPLWALWITYPDPEPMARFWSLVGDCGAAYAAWRILPPWGYWAFLSYWVSPFFTGSAVSGLEMHVAACALLVARIYPLGYLIAASLRPDVAVLALCSSGRKWRWALAGVGIMACVNAAYLGHFLPQTVTSKALAYGIHPGAWGWLTPQGFGWETVALGLALGYVALASIRGGALPRNRLPWLHVGAAIAFLMFHVALGTPQGHWWYAVPSLAMLGFAACQQVRRPWQFGMALAVMIAFLGWQTNDLLMRAIQERNLWITGKQLAKLEPTGTILLEPAGMIPYQNRQLRVIDDVGLIDPWMAERRKLPGWRTAAIERYKPEWVVLRFREYMDPTAWTVGTTAPYNSITESRLQGYKFALLPGMGPDSAGRVRISMESSSLVVLRRKMQP